ncbi:replication factor C subunit 2/4 [Capsaspora owczarzaki ATCC 30864]|uniref:Replication factor C subunit 2/4 n=1 Tax=Capsaspora owczarzaki (strain ATCC 30864) TaxID=595528 RepID=A0A0D2X3A0_CAPO3|nr:replication factor C subunit 2/4 [Capsaspora owczarzaki ATCC 30864]
MSNFFQLNQGASRKRETATSTTTPWVEKYRPRTVDEVAFQDEVVAVLKKSLTSNDFPHLLFYGPPGTGKTSTILAIARQMFGPELMKTRILELNASDERGISVVREKVKTLHQSLRLKGYPCPPFKIIILDEADSMTADAQSALRRMMETYSKTTRFCLICNYVSRIIEPLASRCAKFRFKPLDAGILTEKLTAIGDKEGLQIDASAINQLTAASGGDMRRAITLMQCCFRLNGSDPITADDVVAAAGVCARIIAGSVGIAWKKLTLPPLTQNLGRS